MSNRIVLPPNNNYGGNQFQHNGNGHHSSADVARAQMDSLLRVLSKPAITNDQLNDIRKFVKTSSITNVLEFFNQITVGHNYEEYCFDQKKSYILEDLFMEPEVPLKDKQHMISRILKDESDIHKVLTQQFAKNVFVKMLAHGHSDELEERVFQAIKADFFNICLHKIGNYALQDIMRNTTMRRDDLQKTSGYH
jgi:hypothetical protein